MTVNNRSNILNVSDMKKSICFIFTFTVIFFLAFLSEAKSQYKDGVVPDTSKVLAKMALSESLLFSNLSLQVDTAPESFEFLQTKTTRSLLLLGKIVLNNKTDAPHSFNNFYPETVSDYNSGLHLYNYYGEFPINKFQGNFPLLKN